MSGPDVVKDDDPDVRALSHELTRYLETHPNAADSLEGVVEWWLSTSRYRFARDKVEAALNVLESEGFLSKRVLAGGNIVYACGPRLLGK